MVAPMAPPSVEAVVSAYHTAIVVHSLFIALATTSVLARLYVRFVILKKVGLGMFVADSCLLATM